MFNFERTTPSIPYILDGISVTLQIVFGASILGMALGILLSLCKIGKIWPLS